MRLRNWNVIPEKKGVYAIICPPDFIRDDFKDKGSGGVLKKKKANVVVSELIDKWVDNTNILYIGKVGGKNPRRTLLNRIKEYMLFGSGKSYPHWGGRYIWQLSESNVSQLHLVWRICTDGEAPVKLERDLLNQFKDQYGKFPFANIV